MPEDARVLSAPLTSRLREAIAARWRAREGAEVDLATRTLAAALAAAAAEARDRSLHPEELVLAIKAVEGEVAAEVAASRAELTPGDRRGLRAWLVTVCIRAYFDAP